MAQRPPHLAPSGLGVTQRAALQLSRPVEGSACPLLSRLLLGATEPGLEVKL